MKDYSKPKIVNEPHYKAENLGFGCLGNGTTVWDNTREMNNDYLKVAHISDNGQISYYAQISAEQHEKILSIAKRE